MAQKTRLITPKGTAIWPHLHAPDTKFKTEGEYTVKIALDPQDAQPIIDQLEEMREAYRETAKKEAKGKRVKDADMPYSEDEESGKIIFSFKMKASGKRKDGSEWKMAPAIFDAQGQPVKPGLRVGGGSIIKVAFEPSAFWTALVGLGVSLRLQAVQVIELREFGGGDAKSFGFGAEEGGFSAADAPASNPFGGDDDDAADEDEEFDEEDGEKDDF